MGRFDWDANITYLFGLIHQIFQLLLIVGFTFLSKMKHWA